MLLANPAKYWEQYMYKSVAQKIPPLIQLDLSLTIQGISSLNPGDLIRCDYMPDNYYKNSFFQINLLIINNIIMKILILKS